MALFQWHCRELCWCFVIFVFLNLSFFESQLAGGEIVALSLDTSPKRERMVMGLGEHVARPVRLDGVLLIDRSRLVF